MNKLTIKELSILSKERRNILSFVYNSLSITVLPPLRRVIKGKELFDYKYSIFIEGVFHELLRFHKYNNVADKWFVKDVYDEFHKQFDALIFYDCFNPAKLNHEDTELRRHIIDIMPIIDYQSEFNLVYDDHVIPGAISRSMYEITLERAMNQVRLWNIDKKIDFKDTRILKPPKKKLNLTYE